MNKLGNNERILLKRMTYCNDLEGMISILAKAILKLDDQS